VIIRHGVLTAETSTTISKSTQMLPGNKLGCYFCNDVVAPGDVRLSNDQRLDLTSVVFL
jgi:hypothetical protein